MEQGDRIFHAEDMFLVFWILITQITTVHGQLSWGCEGSYEMLPTSKKCFLYVSGLLKQPDAQSTCSGSGGNLAKIETADEQRFAEHLREQNGNTEEEMWIGLIELSPGDWRWRSDYSVISSTYNNWLGNAVPQEFGAAGEFVNDMACGVIMHASVGSKWWHRNCGDAAPATLCMQEPTKLRIESGTDNLAVDGTVTIIGDAGADILIDGNKQQTAATCTAMQALRNAWVRVTWDTLQDVKQVAIISFLNIGYTKLWVASCVGCTFEECTVNSDYKNILILDACDGGMDSRAVAIEVTFYYTVDTFFSLCEIIVSAVSVTATSTTAATTPTTVPTTPTTAVTTPTTAATTPTTAATTPTTAATTPTTAATTPTTVATTPSTATTTPTTATTTPTTATTTPSTAATTPTTAVTTPTSAATTPSTAATTQTTATTTPSTAATTPTTAATATTTAATTPTTAATTPTTGATTPTSAATIPSTAATTPTTGATTQTTAVTAVTTPIAGVTTANTAVTSTTTAATTPTTAATTPTSAATTDATTQTLAATTTNTPSTTEDPEGPVLARDSLGRAIRNKCTCRCMKSSVPQVEEKAVEKAVEIKKELVVKANTLSKQVAKKASATDERTSSTGIGQIAIVMLVLPFALIVTLDILTFMKWLCKCR